MAKLGYKVTVIVPVLIIVILQAQYLLTVTVIAHSALVLVGNITEVI
jgi:hypothetical protein